MKKGSPTGRKILRCNWNTYHRQPPPLPVVPEETPDTAGRTLCKPFRRPFERGDLKWRRVRLGPSAGSESFQRISSLGSLHVSQEFISISLLLFVVHAVNHTPPHLFTLPFTLPFCPCEPYLK